MNQHITAAIRDAVSVRLGKVEESERNIALCNTEIEVLARAMSILDPSTPLTNIKPRRTRSKPNTKRGEVSGAVIDFLKKGECTFPELMLGVTSALGISQGTDAFAEWSTRIASCQYNLKRQGLLEFTAARDGIKRLRLIAKPP